MVRSFFITEAAGILYQYRPEAQVGALPARGIDSNFERDSGNEEAADPTIAQRDVQIRSFEGRHGDLVDDPFARQRLQLWDDLECGTVS